MLDRWFGPKVHHYLHIVGMMVLVFGLPFNKVLMSIGSIWGVSNLLLEGKFQLYWSRIKNNKAFLFLLAYFCMHLVALLWTQNFQYALHDLRIKLPLLAIPLAWVAHPIVKRNEIHIVLFAFLLSLLMITFVNAYQFINLMALNQNANFREYSVYSSHIRFSLLISIGILLSIYFIFQFKKRWWFFTVIILWLLLYTYYSQVLSGPMALLVAFLFGGFYWVWSKKFIRYSAAILSLISLLLFYMALSSTSPKRTYDFSHLDDYSTYGHLYFHDTLHTSFENQQPIMVYINYDELHQDWEKYFNIPFQGKDKQGNPIKFTFYRYMTYLHLRKDRNGLKKLNKTDIRSIENGIPTPAHLQKGILGRYIALKYSLENKEDPNNSTILQRLEYWKTATEIIRKNAVFGVGTGDVQDAFNQQYEINKTKLLPQFRFRAHNTFLTTQLTFGIFGTLFLILFIAFYLKQNWQAKNLLAFCILGVLLASFFIEDTLETQMGVTVFSFFIALFLIPWEKPADN